MTQKYAGTLPVAKSSESPRFLKTKRFSENKKENNDNNDLKVIVPLILSDVQKIRPPHKLKLIM